MSGDESIDTCGTEVVIQSHDGGTCSAERSMRVVQEHRKEEEIYSDGVEDQSTGIIKSAGDFISRSALETLKALY